MTTLLPAPLAGKGESVPNPLLEAALNYAGRGWPVLPLHSPSNTECSCKKSDCASAGKHPRTLHGLKDATTDSIIIRGWWQRWPDANIGIVTGSVSGIFVVDVDGEPGNSVVRSLGKLPDTLRALTGRKGPSGERAGFHAYFTYPVGVKIPTRAGLTGKGMDIKSDGGYVVAPPSLHFSGLQYEWDKAAYPIANAPAWLLAKASKQIVQSKALLEVGMIHEGERDVRLYRIASNWRRYGASLEEIITRLQALNQRRCTKELTEHHILKIARSAAKTLVGSCDPLESACRQASEEGHYFAYEKVLAVVRHLDAQRRGDTILVPIERTGSLLGIDPSLVSRHRRKLVKQGILEEVEGYIAHQTATRFRVLRLPEK